MPLNINLREVVMRDGLQSLNGFIETNIKIKIINKIINSGFKEIEITSFVNPKKVPQLKDSLKLTSKISKFNKYAFYSALVPNLIGYNNAIYSGIDKIIIVISASNSHNKLNLGKSIKHSILELKYIFKQAKKVNIPIIGSISVAFGCPYEGNIKTSNIIKIIKIFFSLGATSLILADTIGVATPIKIKNMLNLIKKEFPMNFFTMHFHNTNGLGMKNLLSAINVGITSFDTSLGGIGGCPYVPYALGNLATEDVVYLLNSMNIKTGINLKKIIESSAFFKKIIFNELSSCVSNSII